MDTLRKLQAAWKPKHFEHLIYCLKYCKFYYENRFDYQGRKDDTIMIDGKVYTQEDLIKILSEYYDDGQGDFFTSFGDAVYLFFTDLVEDDVDILSEIERIAV